MPLAILIPIVVIGIGGIALLLHAMGKSRRLSLATEEQICTIWNDQYPNSVVKKVHFSQGRHHALLETDAGTGLVWSMGTRAACRELPKGLASIARGSKLIVRPGDYAAPKVSVSLKDAHEAERWSEIIKGNDT